MLLLPPGKERQYTVGLMACPVCKVLYPYEGKGKNIKEALERFYRMMNHHLYYRCEEIMDKPKVVDIFVKVLNECDKYEYEKNHFVVINKPESPKPILRKYDL